MSSKSHTRLVIVNQIDIPNVPALAANNNAPIRCDPQGPEPGPVTAQGMQTGHGGQIHMEANGVETERGTTHFGIDERNRELRQEREQSRLPEQLWQ